MSHGINKVLIAAGGTGGHLFPALALAEELEAQRIEVLFVCSDKKRDRETLAKKGFKFSILKIKPLQKSLDKLLIFTLWLFVGFFQSGLILLKFRPQVCVGFGGYVSVPLIICSGLFGFRTIIHEQNLVPGRANRLLSYFVKKIAVGFEETKEFFPKVRTTYTGNPVRRSVLKPGEGDSDFDERSEKIFFNSEKVFQRPLNKESSTILVIGGSQGSHRLNTIVPRAIFLIDSRIRQNLQVIHLAGECEADFVKESYQRCGIDFRVYGYSDNVGLFYKVSSIVIARAGASTIAELICLKLPSILIPYPYANGHQTFNARFLERHGAAIVFEEAKLTADLLAQNLERLFKDASILLDMKRNIESLPRLNAQEELAKEVLNWGY